MSSKSGDNDPANLFAAYVAYNSELQGSQHPTFDGGPHLNSEHDHGRAENHPYPPPPPSFALWGSTHPFFGGPTGMPYRGAPPPHHHSEQLSEGEKRKGKETETETKKEQDNAHAINMKDDNGEGFTGNSEPENEEHPPQSGRRGGRRGRCGIGKRGGYGGPWGRGAYGKGSHHGSGHRPCPPYGGYGLRGLWERGPPHPFHGLGGLFSGAYEPAVLGEQYWNQFADAHRVNQEENIEKEDFTPEADIFDTESAFVVHVSLPGAKKEDVGVNWNVEKAELCVAGVVYRPGNEAFLKTLTVNERKVGPFERKIRLGTRATPAHIDSDGITAKLEDGVLRIEVPKMDGGFVEIKKVDIE